MPERVTIPLSAFRVELGGDEFKLITNWPFADPYVHRLLKSDIPHRVKYNNGRVWIFKDPLGQPVGFGTFDVCDDYREFANGKPHAYIPLLAVNPTIKSLGYGTSITNYLIAEAALAARELSRCSDILFLDVYASNTKAIALYERLGFRRLTDTPFDDPLEGSNYFVMGRRVSVATPDAQ